MANPKYVSVEYKTQDFAQWSIRLGMAQLLAASGLNEGNTRIYKLREENPERIARYGYLLVGKPDDRGIQTYVIVDLHYAVGGRVHTNFYVEVQSVNQPKWKKLLTSLAPRYSSSNPKIDLTERVAEGFTNDYLPEIRHGFVTDPSFYSGRTRVHQGPIEELNKRVNEILLAYAQQMSKQGISIIIEEPVNS